MAERSIDVQLVHPFIEATIACLTQMADIRPTCLRAFIKEDPLMHGEITGVIGLTGGLTGSCVISFPMDLARFIVARFLREAEASVTEAMIADGIGEVANMVAGGAKSHFAAGGLRFAISTPTLIIGAQACLYNPGGTASFACEFALTPTASDTFLVEVATRSVRRMV